MMNNENSIKEFFSETSLFVAEPIVRGAMSWRSLEDVPNASKSTMFFFDAIKEAKAEMYMTTIRKNDENYAKIYIVDHKRISILYVKSNVVCQGERYHYQ